MTPAIQSPKTLKFWLDLKAEYNQELWQRYICHVSKSFKHLWKAEGLEKAMVIELAREFAKVEQISLEVYPVSGDVLFAETSDYFKARLTRSKFIQYCINKFSI